MAITSEDFLLPVGETISFAGQNLKINKIIGSGYTSVVFAGTLDSNQYRKQIPVAIKVIKPELAGEIGTQIYQGESNLLEQLNSLEQAKDPITLKVLKIAPFYYGSDSYHGNRYIVMELVSGREINTILAEEHRFTEEKATKIAWQLFQFFGVLHEKAHKTVFDFKEENFWWSEENGGQLRIIDMGGLPDLRPDAKYQGNPRLDIIKCCAFIYKLMTGRGLFIPLSQEIEDVRPVLAQTDLSWGARNLFSRCLNLNPDFRFGTAEDGKIAFFDLSDYWSSSDGDLVSITEENLNQFNQASDRFSDESRGYVLRARTAIGVVEKRNLQMSEHMASALKQADQAVEASSYFRAGSDLFAGGAYEAAFTQFKTGLAYGDDKKKFRDWMILAAIGKKVNSADFTEDIKKALVETVELMVKGMYNDASSRLAEIDPVIKKAGADILITECEVYKNWTDARNFSQQGDFTRSVEAVNKTYEITKSLPPELASLMEEIGDLRSYLERERNLANTKGKAAEKEQAALAAVEKDDHKGAVSLVQQAWNDYPVTEFHSESMAKVLRQLLTKNALPEAEKMALFLECVPDRPAPLQDAMDEVRGWVRIQQCFKQKDIIGFVKNLIQVRRIWMLDQTTLPGFEEFLKNCVEVWIESKEIGNLKFVEPELNDLFPDSLWVRNIAHAIQTVSAEKSPELISAVDAAINQIRAQICAITPEASLSNIHTVSPYMVSKVNHQFIDDLKAVQPKVSEALNVARSVHYQEAVLENLGKKIEQLLSDAKTVRVQADKEGSAIKDQEKALEERFTQYLREAASINQKAAPAELQNQGEGINGQLSAMYLEAFRLAAANPEENSKAAELMKKIGDAMDGFGLDGWTRLASDSSARISNFEKGIAEATHEFELGNVDKASAWIERTRAYLSKDPRLVELTAKVNLTQNFLTWKKENEQRLLMHEEAPDLLRQIRFYATKSLPRVYWVNSGALQLLESWNKHLMDWFSTRKTGINAPDYYENLKNFILVRKTSALLSIHLTAAK